MLSLVACEDSVKKNILSGKNCLQGQRQDLPSQEARGHHLWMFTISWRASPPVIPVSLFLILVGGFWWERKLARSNSANRDSYFSWLLLDISSLEPSQKKKKKSSPQSADTAMDLLKAITSPLATVTSSEMRIIGCTSDSTLWAAINVSTKKSSCECMNPYGHQASFINWQLISHIHVSNEWCLNGN